jgi:hypothetical protein
MWSVEGTREFEEWFTGLDDDEAERVAFVVDLLVAQGPTLDHPYTSKVSGSRHSHMRELRIQHRGRPYRVLYAFDPRRTAILLVGGVKGGAACGRSWYMTHVPIADVLYDRYLEELEAEGLT